MIRSGLWPRSGSAWPTFRVDPEPSFDDSGKDVPAGLDIIKRMIIIGILAGREPTTLALR